MKAIRNGLLPAAGAGLITGCGTTSMAVKPEATANVKTVALIEVADPPAYVGNDFGNPGMMFGAVGGAAAGASAASTGGRITAIASEAKYDYSDRLTGELAEQLRAAGYEVKVVSVSRAESHKLLESYEAVPADGVDAIIDVAVKDVGYATEHPMFSPHWRPSASVYIAMVDSSTGAEIYGQKFMYGYHNPFLPGTDIEAPEAYHFKGKDMLFADEAKLLDGLDHSIDAVVSEISRALAKES